MSLHVSDITRPLSEEWLETAGSAWDRLMSREGIGFYEIPQRISLWESSKMRAQEVTARKMGIVGIGGSSLGTKAIRDALIPLKDHDRLHFFENLDDRRFWESVEAMGDLKEIHWTIVSKSGGTLETLAQAEFLIQHCHKKGIDLAQQCTIISEKRPNPLTDWAVKNGVPALEIPLDVGGRYSVLSPVGLFPAAFLGLSVEGFRTGAMWALEQKELAQIITAQVLASFSYKEWISILWCYSHRWQTFGYWLQQLWAESLGKRHDIQGLEAPRASFPVPCLGANDQHSILQQIADGPKDKFILFFREGEAEQQGPSLESNVFSNIDLVKGKALGQLMSANAVATAKSLAERGIHSVSLWSDKITEESLGATFMLFQLVVSMVGEVHGINAFDQPGVEDGKRMARQIISQRT